MHYFFLHNDETFPDYVHHKRVLFCLQIIQIFMIQKVRIIFLHEM